MTRIQAGMLLLLAIPVLWGAMLLGWRSRAARQQAAVPQLRELPPVPDSTGPSGAQANADRLPAPVPGMYVCTTTAADRLDRVVLHGLGNRGDATVRVTDAGVTFQREGEQTLHVPADWVRSARLARGMAGKVVGTRGLVVLTWSPAGASQDTGARSDPGALFDTGFRPRFRRDQAPLLEAVRSLARTDDESPDDHPGGRT